MLADAGFASGEAVAKLEASKIEPLVAIAKTQPHRPYDFRPPPEPKPERRIREPWRLAMKIKLESEEGKARYKKRKQTVEPVFGIIKSAIGFTRFRLRGRRKGRHRMAVVALAYNCRRLCRPAARLNPPPTTLLNAPGDEPDSLLVPAKPEEPMTASHLGPRPTIKPLLRCFAVAAFVLYASPGLRAQPAPPLSSSVSPFVAQPPNVGEARTVATAYHDFGAYARDLAFVASEAGAWIARRAP